MPKAPAMTNSVEEGQGLGTHLLKLLLDIGCQEGLERIIGHILFDNYSMQRVCKKLGCVVNYDSFRGGYERRIYIVTNQEESGMKTKDFETKDGNEAAARVVHELNEVIAILPRHAALADGGMGSCFLLRPC
jgi:hypothetical protein